MRLVARRGAAVVRPGGDVGATVPGTGALGVLLFVTSLAVLFAASLVAYIVIRLRADVWPPPDMPRPPSVLWLSTILLLVSSATIHRALRSIERGDQRGLGLGMSATFLLGLGFLASQIVAWNGMISDRITGSSNLWAFTFFLLTALHGAHVVGGLVPLAFTTVRSWRHRYTWTRHSGVRNCAIYWHFLDVVWLILFVLLVVVR